MSGEEAEGIREEGHNKEEEEEEEEEFVVVDHRTTTTEEEREDDERREAGKEETISVSEVRTHATKDDKQQPRTTTTNASSSSSRSGGGGDEDEEEEWKRESLQERVLRSGGMEKWERLRNTLMSATTNYKYAHRRLRQQPPGGDDNSGDVGVGVGAGQQAPSTSSSTSTQSRERKDEGGTDQSAAQLRSAPSVVRRPKAAASKQSKRPNADRNQQLVDKTLLALKGMAGAAIYSLIFLLATYQTESYLITRWMLLRGIGIVFFIAFVSVGLQIEGLVGSRGILPAIETVEKFLSGINPFFDEKGKASQPYSSFSSRQKLDTFIKFPTVSIFDPSDRCLRWQFYAGCIASIMLILDFVPLFAVIVCYAMYLSIRWVTLEFLMLQWDNLILEVGFLAMFICPLHIWPNMNLADEYLPPSRIMIWLFRLLIFRLMLSSGICKVASGDRSWRDFTALAYHFWTQPLPNRLSYYVHRSPMIFLKFSTAASLFIEIVTPIFMFGSFMFRAAVALLQVLLQLGITTSGNYGFFNYLTIVLCIPLLDDSIYPQFVHEMFNLTTYDPSQISQTLFIVQEVAVLPVAVLVICLSVVTLMDVMKVGDQCPYELRKLAFVLLTYSLVNRYGLFANMTKTRDEVIVEGSVDGKEWKEYEFKYKPSNPDTALPLVPPGHMPRLDWRMWFLPFRPAPWFARFLRRLLEGSQPVLGLLRNNPFPDQPPKYVRAKLYRYEFAKRGSVEPTTTKESEGSEEPAPSPAAWWRRILKGQYTPIMTLNAKAE